MASYEAMRTKGHQMESTQTPPASGNKAKRPTLTVGLFFGGRSAEHAVSLRSAATIDAALRNAGYHVIPIGIERTGTWRYMPLSGEVFHRDVDPKAEAVALAPGGAGQLIARDSATGASGLPCIDVAFPALHGPYGEDGCLQGLFETCGVPYVGAGVLASAVTMDKDVTKRLLREAGLPVVADRLHIAGKPAPTWQSIRASLGPRVFVKPVALGSSIGTAPADDEASFTRALTGALEHGSKVLLETRIAGRELECGVLETVDGPVASLVGEIMAGTQDAFYDYEAKYAADSRATTEVPARLMPEMERRVRSTAVEAFRVLNCRGLARVDFFLNDRGELFINEINTMPGFTSISLFPRMFEASGIGIADQVKRVIEIAIGHA